MRCCATCSSTSPARRTAPRSRSTSCSIRRRRTAGRGSSSCARSRCRRTRAWPPRRSILVRALLAAFAASRTGTPLVRWGAELHDRFLLPYYMWRDFEDVLALPRRARRRAAGRGVPPVRRAALPARRHARGRRRARRGAQRDRAVARARRGGDRDRHLALRRFVDGAHRDPHARPRSTSATSSRSTASRCRCGAPPAATSASAACGSARGARRTRCIRTSASTTRCGSTSSTRGRKRGVAGGAYHVWHPEGRAFDAAAADARRGRRAPRAALHRRRPGAVAAARTPRRAAPRAAVHARPPPLRCRRVRCRARRTG